MKWWRKMVYSCETVTGSVGRSALETFKYSLASYLTNTSSFCISKNLNHIILSIGIKPKGI